MRQGFPTPYLITLAYVFLPLYIHSSYSYGVPSNQQTSTLNFSLSLLSPLSLLSLMESCENNSSPPSSPPIILSPCAACKILRRRCVEKCVLAPYFPPTEPLKFTTAHRVFGASNIIKFLQVCQSYQTHILHNIISIFILYSCILIYFRSYRKIKEPTR